MINDGTRHSILRGPADSQSVSRLDTPKTPYYYYNMPLTLDAVIKDALVLSPDERLALARRLLDSVDLEPEPGAEAAWESEIARRIARFRAGESKPIPAGEVFARLRQIAPER
jgi:putative addiction module component (TIGR02574 family)